MMRFWPASGGAMGGVSSGAAEAGVIIPTGFGEHRDRLGALQAEAEHLLSGLDELGLSQAAAYLSMALDVMRAARPDPLRTG